MFRTILGALALMTLGVVGASAQSTGPAILRPPAGIALDSGTKTATATAGAATLNKLSGKVTSEALTTAAAGGLYSLTITNSTVSAADIVLASTTPGTNTQGYPVVTRVTPANGSIVVHIRNFDTTNAFNGSLVVSFAVIKN